MKARDTTAQARQVQIDALRRLGAVGRLGQAFEMSEQTRAISIRGWLARHAGWSPERARGEVLRRVLGAELYEAAYGRDRS